MNIRALNHLYTTPIATLLYRHRGKFAGEGAESLAKFDLDATLLADYQWKAAANMTRRITRALGEDMAAVGVEKTIAPERRFWVERLAPEQVTPWAKSEDEASVRRFLLPIETNPATLLHVGVISQHVEVGTLLWYEHRLFHSLMNYGKHPVIHLFAEFRLTEAAP